MRLRAAIDAAPSGILMTDAQGRVVLLNRQIESMFGYSREEVLGKPVEMLVPERYRSGHPELRAAFMGAARVRSMGAGRDLSGLRKDGTEVPLEIVLTPVATDEGMFVLSTIVDISARKGAEERFRIAVESSPNGMLMIDREGRMILVNRQIEVMFGYSRSELLGHSIEMLVPERFRAAHPERRAQFYAQPSTRAMGVGRELFGVRKDGSEISVEIGLNPIQTEDGLLVLGSVVDISARKRAEQDRRRLEDQLRQAQKMEAIGRLASGVAHDFNNLLTGIIACAELVKRSVSGNAATLSILDEMCEAAQRGATLTRDLLDLGRRRPINLTGSDLNAVVRVAERMLRQVIGEDIALAVELFPSGGPILGDPTHLEHVLLNLVVNARDAMPHGGRLRIATREFDTTEPVRTRGRELPAGRYVVLEVEDSGTGMDAATQERLFEPFFTTKAIGNGTGLGLYTVHSIIEQLGGGIDFESEPGRGTRFTVYLPRHEQIPAVAAVPRAETPSRGSVAARSAARILMLEDDRLIRVSLRRMLEGLGYEILVAENGAQALKVAREFDGPIDLLLSDIVLPDSSGTEIASVLTRERPTLKVLFMSAYPSDLLVQQERVPPGTKTLEKPFDEEKLATAVRFALDEARQAAQGQPS
jgi:hypothetical protein